MQQGNINYMSLLGKGRLTCDGKYGHYLMDCMVQYNLMLHLNLIWSHNNASLLGSYEYFIFIKLKVKFQCCVSVLHYNSMSDIRTQESMNKFRISDIPSEYTYPTRVLVLPIACSLQRRATNFGWNSDIRNVIKILQNVLDSFRSMIEVVVFGFFFLFPCTELIALFGIQLQDQPPASQWELSVGLRQAGALSLPGWQERKLYCSMV